MPRWQGNAMSLTICSSNDNTCQQLRVIRIIEAKFVAGTCVDPVRRSRAAPAVCKEHLLAFVYRDKNLSDAPIGGVPGNRRIARPFVGWHGVGAGAKKGRPFFEQAKCSLVSFGIGWSRARCVPNRDIREEVPSRAVDQSLQPLI